MEESNNLNKEETIRAVKLITDFMNINCQIEASTEGGGNDKEKCLLISIQTLDNARFLIGKNGQNLKAFEHIVRSILSKKDNKASVVLDVNDYKKSRSSYLIDVARQAVTRVRNTRKAEALFPMSAYERRIVHMELASCPDITTESIGSEPQRRIVIKPFL